MTQQNQNHEDDSNKPPSQRVNPMQNSSWLGIITVWYMQSTMMLGSRKPLDADDIFPLPAKENPAYVMKLFETEFKRRQEAGEKVSTLRTVIAVWGTRLFLAGFLEFGFYLAQMFIPFFIKDIITFLQSDDRQYLGDASYGVWYALGLFVASVVSSISINNKFYHVTRTAMRMRSALMTAIYAKSLRLSSASRQGSTTGETINLMSGDASRVFEMMIFVNTLWVSPLVICIVLGLLLWQIGYAALTTVVLMTLLLPIQFVMARKIGKTRREMLKHTDERVKLMSEILQGIRVIKLYAWEIPMHKKIATVRELEVAQLWLSTYLKQINQAILFVWPALVTFCTFVTYSLLGNEVIYTQVFIVLSFLNVLRFPISLLPTAINSTSEAFISFRRLDHFFALSELQNWEQRQYKDSIFAKLNKMTHHIGTVDHTKQDPKQRLLTSSSSQSQLVDESSLTPEELELYHQVGTIHVKNGEFRWDPASERPTLSGITLDIEKGQLVGIIGQVGSGKSSLISAVLGEMSYTNDSDIAVNGCVSYMSQKPWVRNTSVKNNILFGLPYNESIYQQCLHAAALLPDLAILPAGDSTEIGEQGLNLSGGQKARVSMARSLYRAHLSDIFIMDDPFSAVDMNVGKHMFEEGVFKMLKHKTRLVVLNSHLHFLKQFDKIIVLDAMEGSSSGGRIVAQGTYDQISAQYGELMRVMEAQSQLSRGMSSEHEEYKSFHQRTMSRSQIHEQEEEKQEQDLLTHKSSTQDVYANESEQNIDPTSSSTASPKSPSQLDVINSVGIKSGSTKSMHPSQHNVIPPKQASPQPTGTLITTEERSVGAVKWEVYQQYFAVAMRGYGTTVLCAIIALFIVSQGARLGSDVWVTYWGRDSNHAHSTLWWIIAYLLWICATWILALLRSWIFSNISVRASQALHDNLFAKLLRAPVTTFFDTTPVGRIINRFSKDLDQVDTILPDYLSQLLQFTFQLGSAVVLACVATPYFLAILGPVFFLFVWIQGYYRRSSRELKRLEGSTRSPIFSSFGETLTGLATIRAYGMVQDMITENQRAVDENGKIFLATQFAERWLSVRLEMCASTIIGGIAILAVTLSGISPSIAGLAIVYVLQLGGLLQWTVRVSIQVESTMTSVERLTSYSEMTSEASPHIPETYPAYEWPTKGAIEFENIHMRYRPELDLVLKGVSCYVKPNEKIGICGRTGSGKSSLMVALFRLVELASGTIRIDGVDISKIGLSDLRAKLSIIPQDPVLFSGTVRKNLDPFENHTDQSVWQALERVSLATVIRGLDGQLSHAVAENGDNFSHGQRQLICIARALLRKSKILIMDEATAAVDSETDKLIQATIRLNFDDCTVLTIAHRLDTIIDADRILVLSGGNIVEFDRPLALLQRPDSAFRSMVSEGGAAVVASLTKMAQEAENVRQLVSKDEQTQHSTLEKQSNNIITTPHKASNTTDSDSEPPQQQQRLNESSELASRVVFHEASVTQSRRTSTSSSSPETSQNRHL